MQSYFLVRFSGLRNGWFNASIVLGRNLGTATAQKMSVKLKYVFKLPFGVNSSHVFGCRWLHNHFYRSAIGAKDGCFNPPIWREGSVASEWNQYQKRAKSVLFQDLYYILRKKYANILQQEIQVGPIKLYTCLPSFVKKGQGGSELDLTICTHAYVSSNKYLIGRPGSVYSWTSLAAPFSTIIWTFIGLSVSSIAVVLLLHQILDNKLGHPTKVPPHNNNNNSRPCGSININSLMEYL